MGDVAAMGVLRGPGGLGAPGVLWPRIGGAARRCLFGPPDPEKTHNFLESETERLAGEGRAKWNFDFAAGKPLDGGRFAWTPAGAGDDNEGDVKSGDVQTRITDFMRKRKLPSSSPKDEPTSSPEEPRTKTRRRFST